MKHFILVASLVLARTACAQEFLKPEPSGPHDGAVLTLPQALIRETAATVHDLFTTRDRQWQSLTLAQISAAALDGGTSIHRLRDCTTCTGIGIPRFIVGQRPDIHKYVLAGVLEIGVEAVTAHYLRAHGSGTSQNWISRTLWRLPQSISSIAHVRASIGNLRLKP